MSFNAYDFNINLEKIESEAEKAVQRESRYWRENDAKLRAVHQKVATYEDFKNIVSASHLKPLNKNENLGQMTKGGRNNRNSHWNNFATENINKSIETDFHKKSNPSSFICGNKCDLNNLSEHELYEKLHHFYHTDSLDIFRTEIPSEILLRYCRVLLGQVELQSVDAGVNWNIFDYLGRNAARLALTMAFMDADEQSVVRSAIDTVHRHLDDQSIAKSEVLRLFALE